MYSTVHELHLVSSAAIVILIRDHEKIKGKLKRYVRASPTQFAVAGQIRSCIVKCGFGRERPSCRRRLLTRRCRERTSESRLIYIHDSHLCNWRIQYSLSSYLVTIWNKRGVGSPAPPTWQVVLIQALPRSRESSSETTLFLAQRSSIIKVGMDDSCPQLSLFFRLRISRN
ncbi:hypothetical protein VTK26DRAFT_778 [Humicola hyalothermophila]